MSSSPPGVSFEPLAREYRNILVIEFGQLGDVVLSLPAFHALRQRFPAARITALVGISGRAVIELAGFIDAVIPVDRVALRDGPKRRALGAIVALVRDLRRRRFDLVIDLQSLPETNLLGWASGAPHACGRLAVGRTDAAVRSPATAIP